MMCMKRYWPNSLGALALICAILGARMGLSWLSYGVVLSVVVATVLAALQRISTANYPYLIGAFGVALLYQTTLMGPGLVGTDIHTEYYFYLESLDGWDISIPHNYNAAIGTTVIAPFLTHAFQIPGYWIYKAVFPALFASVPVMLYYVYRREFGEHVAFLGCVLFVTLPTYLLEMIGLPRQMLAEIMLAAILLLIIVRPLRLRYAVPLIALSGVLGLMFHYLTGPMILGYLICGGVILAIQRRRAFPAKWVGVAVCVMVLGGYLYYSNVAGGSIMEDIGIVANSTVSKTANAVVAPPSTISDPITGKAVTGNLGYFETQEPLIRTALGLDFMDANIPGKVFRVFQFLMELSLILGGIYLILKRKKLSAEYLAFTITAILLVGACVILPRFSNLVNASRFYHLSMFMVAPLFVVGALYVCRKLKYTLILIIPYILLTTGVVFEATGQTDLSKINLPYSIALSNNRVGMVGNFTQNDLDVKDWAAANHCEPVFMDINGMLIFSESYDPFTFTYAQRKGTKSLTMGWAYFPKDVSTLPVGSYLFLSEWNMQNQAVYFKPQWYDMKDTATGMRQLYPFEFLGLPRGEVVYNSGDAVLLKIGE